MNDGDWSSSDKCKKRETQQCLQWSGTRSTLLSGQEVACLFHKIGAVMMVDWCWRPKGGGLR